LSLGMVGLGSYGCGAAPGTSGTSDASTTATNGATTGTGTSGGTTASTGATNGSGFGVLNLTIQFQPLPTRLRSTSPLSPSPSRLSPSVSRQAVTLPP